MKKTLFFLAIIFCTNLNAQFTKLHDFDSINGRGPFGSLFFDNTFLYGMSNLGGAFDKGTLFKIMPNGTNYNTLIDFEGTTTNGSQPQGSLISDGTFLYGMTVSNIFKVMPDGSNFTIILNFNSITGSNPYGALFYDGTFLYGMTISGGTYGDGTIFKVMPDGTNYTKLHDFGLGSFDGKRPRGSLILNGTFLYGMTCEGGFFDFGTIFKIMPNGTGYTKLFDFDGVNGEAPYEDLISVGTFFYGITSYGGINNVGTIFKILPDGTGYTKLHDFDNINETVPHGALISDGNFLYGMTYAGGSNGVGAIFRIMTDGTGYTKLHDFDIINGSIPRGSLISDGNSFYGITVYGGTNNFGTIFKFHDNTIGIEEIINADVSIYPNPSNNSFIFKTSNFIGNTMLVYNMLGKEVYKTTIIKSTTTIPVNELGNEGVYLLKTINKNTNEIRTSRLVVTK